MASLCQRPDNSAERDRACAGDALDNALADIECIGAVLAEMGDGEERRQVALSYLAERLLEQKAIACDAFARLTQPDERPAAIDAKPA